MPGTVVIAGALAQRPGKGGHTWVVLQYLLGFRRLGWKVVFLDRLDPEMCVDRHGHPCDFELSWNLAYFMDVMQRFGLSGMFSLTYSRGERFVGLSRREVLERTGNSVLLVNIMGFLVDEEILSRTKRRVFLDIDPGFGQMWRELGLADVFSGHDSYVTIGENIGKPGCAIPTGGLDWITIRPAVVLDYWPFQRQVGEAFTSVASWRGPFGPVTYRGQTYGLRVHEFRKFVQLPYQSGRSFELALDIHPDEISDLALLTASGWTLMQPSAVAGDPSAYQKYIQSSKAEFNVAKNMYVQTNSGWFSDRSACYLASGRPVLAQATGFQERYPTGEGLLVFSTLEEALAGVEEISRAPARHARAARGIAEEYFDSDKVLSQLLGNLNIA